jgi:hypothetical protein
MGRRLDFCLYIVQSWLKLYINKEKSQDRSHLISQIRAQINGTRHFSVVEGWVTVSPCAVGHGSGPASLSQVLDHGLLVTPVTYTE